jgi:glycerol-3-phosphate dehydrogenase
VNRAQTLQWLTSHPEPSVLIIGAGINGIGTFRDLALNGVDVVLIDRGDFCSGASAASSHMAHGGIRYLENGEFRLVHEAVQERNRMLRNAPHLVKPLPTTIPIFTLLSGLLNAPLKFAGLLDRPSERGAFVIKVGLVLYDAYTGAARTVPRHNFMNARESLARWPALDTALRYTATYYDGAILQPERLGLELVLDAETDTQEAHALNYVECTGFEDGQLHLCDVEMGSEFRVRPRLVVNATGAWIDRTNRLLRSPTAYIGGTKGSHLILDHPELRAAIGDHEFFFENRDGRIVLIFPLFDRVLVGTSDIPISDPDEAKCSSQEVEYFLEMIGRVFPRIRVGPEHIVFRFSGVRPLAASKTRTTGQITRDHEIQTLQPEHTGFAFPILSLVGGKWTSYRAFSEQVADRALSILGRKRSRDTRSLAIGGGAGFAVDGGSMGAAAGQLMNQWGLAADKAAHLYARYGTHANQLAEYIAEGADQDLPGRLSYSRREMEFLASEEKVVHLDDLILRRSLLGMLGDVGPETLRVVAEAAAVALQWDEARTRFEVTRTAELLRERHGVAL